MNSRLFIAQNVIRDSASTYIVYIMSRICIGLEWDAFLLWFMSDTNEKHTTAALLYTVLCVCEFVNIYSLQIDSPINERGTQTDGRPEIVSALINTPYTRAFVYILILV